MNPDPKDQTVAASASSVARRNETASAYETGRGTPAGPTIDLSFLAPSQSTDEIGRLGKYRILAVLGHGGMGLVFRAEDPALKRGVAVKVMLPRFANDTHARARFIREARAQAAVEHDHIVPIHDVADNHNPPFIVMPLLKGMTLAAALKANSKPPLPAIVRIGREIAEGLAAAHESGLIHRDIKPANIWLEGSKLRVRILDFGLARAAAETDPAVTGEEPLTADGAVVGTPMYMSPEQARGEDLDCRTDLFSLGVILYQMATGEMPFTGRTTASVLLAVVNHEPKGLSNANLPPALSTIIERLLTKDRHAAGRPAAAAVIADELKQIEYGLAAVAVQVVPLDSIPDVPAAPNPFAEIDTTAAEVESDAVPVREKKPVSKAWIFGGVAALVAVLAAAGVMFKLMTKSDQPVVKNEEPPPAPPPGPKPAPKQKEQGVIPNYDQRKVLEAMLEWGGAVDVSAGGGRQRFETGGKLPASSFDTLGISLKAVTLDDAKIERLRGLPPIAEDLTLAGTGITGAEFAKLIANPAFASLKHLDLSETKIVGEGYAPLAKFKNLVKIDLTRTPFASTDLKHLEGLSLEWLSFHSCGSVNDDGLEHIAEMTSLTHLWFMHTPVTEKGIAKLTKLQKLRYLHPGSCSDAGVESILRFPLIEDLHLAGSKITAKGVDELSKLPKVRFLQAPTLLIDADVDRLSLWPALTGLSLYDHGDKLTDAGLAKLAGCKRLTALNVAKTMVTKAGVDALAEKLPNAEIIWDGGKVGPKDMNRPAAEKLRTHNFTLTIRTPDGKEPYLKPTDPLPAGPFDVLSVAPPNAGPLPEDFVRTVLLPTIESLPKLQNISDSWAVTTWSEADLAKLADAPAAAKLLGIRGGFRLTPGAVTALKRIPNLADLGCLVGPDEALPLLKELTGLSWLVLMAPTGKTHTFGADAWATLTSLRLGALELYGITIDPAAAKMLAAMKLFNTQLLTFAICPGALEHLGAFQSSTTVRAMVIRAPLTDQDLPRFHPLSELRSLSLHHPTGTTQLTKPALEKLAEKLPNCMISVDGVPFWPKDLNRFAAEKLRGHNFSITIRTPEGKEPYLKPTDPLPAGPFDVLSVTPPNAGPLPEDFVRTVLLPTIESLPKLQYLADQWAVTIWSEADLAKLADSPAAAHLLGVKGSFKLTTGALAALKRIPNLGLLGCLAGPDEALTSLKELTGLSWLVLMAPTGTTHTFGAAGWDGITNLKALAALELYDVNIDAAAAKKLAAMKLSNTQHLTLAICPGALEHLSEFQSSTTVRAMTFRGPLTDQDLLRFHPLTNLRSLALQTGNSPLTKAAVEKLSEQLPQCKISWKGTTFGPKDVNRYAAEKLRAHNFSLMVSTSDGQRTRLNPADPLPAEPFEVSLIAPPKSEPLHKDFVRTVLLPAIEPLSKLQVITDYWAVTTWSEADVARLADSPVAANLLELRGGFRLTPGAVAALKRIPNLSGLGCLAGPDEMLVSLKELPKLSWLVLIAPTGTTHRFGVAGWDTITSLKLKGLELSGITIDAATAKKIAAMKTLDETLITFADCPSALEHLVEFQSSTAFRAMIFRGPFTDQDLSRFHPLTELRSLTLDSWATQPLTKAAVEKLAEKLPNCKITWNGATFGPKQPPKK